MDSASPCRHKKQRAFPSLAAQRSVFLLNGRLLKKLISWHLVIYRFQHILSASKTGLRSKVEIPSFSRPAKKIELSLLSTLNAQLSKIHLQQSLKWRYQCILSAPKIGLTRKVQVPSFSSVTKSRLNDEWSKLQLNATPSQIENRKSSRAAFCKGR